MSEGHRRILRPCDVAKMIGCTPRYVAILIDMGKLKGFRLPGSKHRRVYADVLERFMKDNMKEIER